jgi:hypothetical protein
MDVSILANAINVLAVTAGVIFAATQIRDYRAQRRRDSMTALVRSFQNAAFAQALRRVSALPNDATLEQIEEKLGRNGEDHIWLLLSTWEALAILLCRRELTIELVDDFFSGPIAVSWRKLKVCRSQARQGAAPDLL